MKSRFSIIPFGLPLASVLLGSLAFAQDTKPAPDTKPAQDAPVDAAAQKALGAELLRAGRKFEAASAFKKAYEADGTIESGLSWARALLADERYNDSLGALDTIAEKYKKNLELFKFFAEALETRALARSREGADRITVCAEYESAARSIEDALELKPDDPELLSADIRYLLYAGKLDEAAEAAEKARKTAPGSWEVAMWSGDSLYYSMAAAGLVQPKDRDDDAADAIRKERKEKIAGVLAAYGEAVKLGADRAEPQARIGAFLLATGGDKQKALAAFGRAVALDPTKVDLTAAIDEKIMSPKDGLEFFTKALGEFKKNHTKTDAAGEKGEALIQWFVGRYKFLADDRKGAIESFRAALAKNPEEMSARYWLGRIHYFEKQYKEATKEFETIARKSPKDLAALGSTDAGAFYPMLQNLVGRLLAGEVAGGSVTGVQNNAGLQTAILFTRAMVEVDPKNVIEWNNLGLFHRDSGNAKESLFCYKKALDITPTDPRLLNDTGVIYHYYLPKSAENDAEAKQLYQRSIQLAKAVLDDKKAGSTDKESARGALQDATTNLKRLDKGDHTNN
ncbi:MAG: tetratricopeptide repeat protein [Planctomycetes bacterium]|nr:tetratricopeptide repeat protein [Planctomycetota bacterium]